MTAKPGLRSLAKPAVFVLCLVPVAWLAGRAFFGTLGANPIEASNRFLGDWTLRFLLIALAVTPVKELAGLAWLARFRRMLGLFAFAYAALHVSSYVVLDQFFDWNEIWKDILKRRYITVGMITLTLLVPLAVTSTNAMAKRLGGRNWQRLHRIVYLAGCTAVLHFYMMVKADVREPLLYAFILASLLGYRLIRAGRRRMARSREARPQAA